MKTLKKLSFVCVLVLFFSGCDALGDLLTVKIQNVSMSKEIEITVNSSSTVKKQAVNASAAIAFTKTATLQLSETDTLKDYLDNIKSITLKSVICNIHGVSNGIVTSLKLTINPLNISKTLSDIEVNKDLTVDFTTEELKSIADSLLQSKELEFVLDGVVNHVPVTFYVKVTANADFVAKVIKN